MVKSLTLKPHSYLQNKIKEDFILYIYIYIIAKEGLASAVFKLNEASGALSTSRWKHFSCVGEAARFESPGLRIPFECSVTSVLLAMPRIYDIRIRYMTLDFCSLLIHLFFFILQV